MGRRFGRRRFLTYSLYGGAALLAAYPLVVERYLFQVNTYRIPVPRLPPALSGLRIVQVTDLHFGFLMPLTVVRRLLRTANALRGDAIVCTGDYVHRRNQTAQVETVWPELMRLAAPLGVWSVLGNHDHWADNDRSLYWLERSGQSLRHKAAALEKNGARIWIGGAGDFWEDSLGIDRAFDRLPPDECKILLAHNPDTADSPHRTQIDLMICGHTHGGQVVLPLVGPPILPVANKRYSSGFIRTDTTNLYISRGLGWAILPVRFNCRPEISVLELVPEPEAPAG